MRIAILFISFICLFSCKRERTKGILDKNKNAYQVEDIVYQKEETIDQIKKDTLSKKVDFTEEIKDLKDISFPFCIKKPSKRSTFYDIQIDSFLSFHKMSKSSNLFISSKFHKRTNDFITEKENPFYTFYPYQGNSEDTQPYAINKIKINDDITAIFYAYIKISDLLVPSIELQTFDKEGNNIDNLVVYYYYVNECSSYRNFCIDKNLKINIYTYLHCSGDYDAESKDIRFKNNAIFSINEKGKFIRIK